MCVDALWRLAVAGASSYKKKKKKSQTYTVSIANSLIVVNEKCAIQWAGERARRGVGGRSMSLVHIWWRGCQWTGGRQEKALEFTVVSKRRTQSTGRMNELVLTSIMNNMNITYQMPHVGTKLYSYIYSMYVQRGIRKSEWGLRKKDKRWTAGFIPFGVVCRWRKEIRRQQLYAGWNYFFGDNLIIIQSFGMLNKKSERPKPRRGNGFLWILTEQIQHLLTMKISWNKKRNLCLSTVPSY